MKKALAAVMVLLVVVLVGFGFWYWGYTSRAEAQANDYASWVQQQKLMPVEFVVTGIPENTPSDQPLYLSGSAVTLGNWEAAGVPLQRGDDGKHRAKVELMSGIQHGFKVTRGTWGTVERGAGGADMPNRTVEIDAPDKVVEVQVATWVDEGKAVPNRQTLAGDIRLHRKFHSNLLNNDRDLIVYLPPNYDADENTRYPVLYLQDGQNLMNEATAYAGVEWRVDEAAQRLIAENRMQPIIIVGIYNTETRTAEFTPNGFPSPQQQPPAEARGDDYAKMIATEIKPFIDERYRTSTAAADTGIGGAGQGGAISLHAVHQHPDVFGRVLLMTPFLRIGDQPLLGKWNNDASFLKGKRVWLDTGTDAGGFLPGNPVEDARAVVTAAEAAGLKQGEDLTYNQIEGIAHGEAIWSGRIEQVLSFLYPPKK